MIHLNQDKINEIQINDNHESKMAISNTGLQDLCKNYWHI